MTLIARPLKARCGLCLRTERIRSLWLLQHMGERSYQRISRCARPGSVTSGTLVRTDAARLAAGDRPIDWPWPDERVSIPHLTVRTPDGARPIMLEATFYPPTGSGPAPLAMSAEMS
jgi:hypothetical protein